MYIPSSSSFLTRRLGESTLETLFLKKGFWRATETGLAILECPIVNSCEGGSEFSKDGESYCSKGHQGVLCAVCDGEYFFDSERNICRKCNDVSKNQSLWTFLLVLFTIVVVCMGWKNFLTAEAQRIILNIFDRIKQKISTIVIMLQIATSISDNLSISFPIAFTEFLGMFNFVNMSPLQIFPLGCVGKVNVSRDYTDRNDTGTETHLKRSNHPLLLLGCL